MADMKPQNLQSIQRVIQTDVIPGAFSPTKAYSPIEKPDERAVYEKQWRKYMRESDEKIILLTGGSLDDLKDLNDETYDAGTLLAPRTGPTLNAQLVPEAPFRPLVSISH